MLDKSNLSETGKRLYDEYGYHSETIPYAIIDKMDKTGELFYINIEFVLDEEKLQGLKDVPDNYRPEFVAEHLEYLVDKGFVLRVTSEGKGPIESLEELKDELNENLQLFGL